MQPPTDNLYKFLAIFGLFVAAFSIYVPLLRYMEFNRLTLRADAIYEPMIDPTRSVLDESLAELECEVYKSNARDGKKATMPDPCLKLSDARVKASRARSDLERLKLQLVPVETERNAVWQEYRIFLYIGIAGLILGVGMCGVGFWLWYVRLQRYLDATTKSEASASRRYKSCGGNARRNS